jgi:hypothetical protein
MTLMLILVQVAMEANDPLDLSPASHDDMKYPEEDPECFGNSAKFL